MFEFGDQLIAAAALLTHLGFESGSVSGLLRSQFLLLVSQGSSHLLEVGDDVAS